MKEHEEKCEGKMRKLLTWNQNGRRGVPTMAQWQRIRLVSMRMRVRSLASCSRPGNTSSTPLAWELPYATGAVLKSKNK